MALTDDQRAMLRLLAQNDESYEDIAALKGVSVEQVRSEVKAALAAAAAEQETPVPEPPKAAAPPPPERPAEEKTPPPAEKPPVTKPAAAPGSATRGPRGSLPPERRRLLLFAGGALAIVAVALALIAVISGGSDSAGSTTEAGGSEPAGSTNAKLTQAKLEPVGGGEAAGQAVFGRLKKKIILLVEATGLEPNPKGTSYTIWLYKSPKLALRVGSLKVTKSGGLRAPFQLTPEIFGAVLARVFDQVYVSRTEDAAYKREVEQAEKQKKLPPYTGETVLRGEITGPVVKEAAGEGH